MGVGGEEKTTLLFWVFSCGTALLDVQQDCPKIMQERETLYTPVTHTIHSVKHTHMEDIYGPSPFFFFCIVPCFNTMKCLTPSVHAGLFRCFQYPPNSDMEGLQDLECAVVIFLCAYTHRGISVYSLIQRIFVQSAQNMALEKSQGAHIAKPST